MIASGVDPSFQLQPGISPDGCSADGTTTNRGWTEATLREFLSFLDEKGVRVVTIWTSDAFLMPSTTFTCPWFMPMLHDWVGAKSDDEASGSEAAQPRSLRRSSDHPRSLRSRTSSSTSCRSSPAAALRSGTRTKAALSCPDRPCVPS